MGGRGYSENHTTRWGTPKDRFKVWSDEVGGFDLDPCTEPNNPLNTPHFYTEQDDGLEKPWFGKVFVNCPYGGVNLGKWFKKAFAEWKTGLCSVIYFLAPVRGFDAKRHHNYICKCNGKPDLSGTSCNGWREGIEVRLLAGRLKFYDIQNANDPGHAGTFGSMLIIFNGLSAPLNSSLRQAEREFHDLVEWGLHV